MKEQCPECGAFVTEQDFDEMSSSQHCPQCHAALPQELAAALRDAYERETVLCPTCGCRTWLADVDVGELGGVGYVCPGCGGKFPEKLQGRIAFGQEYGSEEEWKEDMLETMFPDGQDEDDGE